MKFLGPPVNPPNKITWRIWFECSALNVATILVSICLSHRNLSLRQFWWKYSKSSAWTINYVTIGEKHVVLKLLTNHDKCPWTLWMKRKPFPRNMLPELWIFTNEVPPKLQNGIPGLFEFGAIIVSQKLAKLVACFVFEPCDWSRQPNKNTYCWC